MDMLLKHAASFTVCLAGFTFIAFIIDIFKNDLSVLGPFFMGITFYFPVMAVIVFAYRVQR